MANVAIAGAQLTKKCPACKQPRSVDPADDCPTCQILADQKRLERARKDRRAEFYDVRGNGLTIRLVFEGSLWASFVEHQKGKTLRVGMREEFDEREPAVDRFKDLVRQVLAMGGWRAVHEKLCIPWDLRSVDPRRIDEVDV